MYQGAVILKRFKVHQDKPENWQQVFSQEFQSQQEAEDYVEETGWFPCSSQFLIKIETPKGELITLF